MDDHGHHRGCELTVPDRHLDVHKAMADMAGVADRSMANSNSSIMAAMATTSPMEPNLVLRTMHISDEISEIREEAQEFRVLYFIDIIHKL